MLICNVHNLNSNSFRLSLSLLSMFQDKRMATSFLNFPFIHFYKSFNTTFSLCLTNSPWEFKNCEYNMLYEKVNYFRGFRNVTHTFSLGLTTKLWCFACFKVYNCTWLLHLFDIYLVTHDTCVCVCLLNR